MQQLQPNTTLQGGRYRILRTLGQGGFGITYLALQSGLERKVAVKEFFMKDLCGRDADSSRVTLGTEGSRETVGRFREKFLKEARNIASLSHPNIVRIIDVFEENGTAYYVMEYAEGGSLADKVRHEGALKEAEATRYILRVAEALGYVHQRKMNHLDVKPSNIMLNAEGEPVLIDFGLAKQYDAATDGQTSSTPVGISEGYAPKEQYKLGGVATFSPEADIYALGATFFKLLTGVTPPSALDVDEDGLPIEELAKRGVSDKAVAVISHAMQPRKKDRPKDVGAFIAALSASGQDEKPKTDKSDLTQHPEQANLAAEETQLQDSAPKPEQKNMAARTFTVKGVSFKMIHVQAGTFTMGATSEQEDPGSDEEPPHRVTLTDDYWMGETQVTQALWKAVMGSNPSEFKGDERPVECVSWEDCQDFIAKLNRITGKRFRLPTEAEWEYAARGGSKSRGYQYAGSNNLDEVAWYDRGVFKDLFTENRTHPVGQKQPNELGMYDMSGNVWEWCQDWYGSYSSSSQTDPTGPSRGSGRVLRGGSRFYFARGCRSSNRFNDSPGCRISSFGFRLVLSE
ncbi:MAG: bifunctional serine/threonine-protein kinase/formylglycine-generating enzyme family protein [Bacteroidales bacterium]|nr:bifunctional serine/threonine-protein kinase/formylglycine-generating enzyme family protein [Bacteroidales bacterium]